MGAAGFRNDPNNAWVIFSTSSLSLQHRGIYSLSLSGLRLRVTYSAADHIHMPARPPPPHPPLLPPPSPPAHRHLECLFCLVALSYGALTHRNLSAQLERSGSEEVGL